MEAAALAGSCSAEGLWVGGLEQLDERGGGALGACLTALSAHVRGPDRNFEM